MYAPEPNPGGGKLARTVRGLAGRVLCRNGVFQTGVTSSLMGFCSDKSAVFTQMSITPADGSTHQRVGSTSRHHSACSNIHKYPPAANHKCVAIKPKKKGMSQIRILRWSSVFTVCLVMNFDTCLVPRL